MRNHVTLLLAAAFSVLAGSPAYAINFQFFEGNNCTQKALGSLDSENMSNGDLQRKTLDYNQWFYGLAISPGGGWNDEARSVRVTSNANQVSEIKAIVLTVHDRADRSSKDDWARVRVRNATLIPPEGLCIGSFERPFDKAGVYLERHPNNGLDGKISAIMLDCDAACRNNKSVPGSAFKTKIARKSK